MVTRNDNHIAFALNQRFKRRTINRMIKRLLNKLSRTLLRLIRRRIRHKNPLHKPFINGHFYTFIIIRKRIRLHTSTSCCIYNKYTKNTQEQRNLLLNLIKLKYLGMREPSKEIDFGPVPYSPWRCSEILFSIYS